MTIQNNRKVEASYEISGIVTVERESSMIKVSATNTIYFRTPKPIIDSLKSKGLDLKTIKKKDLNLNCYLVDDDRELPAVIFEFIKPGDKS